MKGFRIAIAPTSPGRDGVFDGILNTADYRELRKEVLWDRAFVLLGDDLGYASSLLIEDGPQEPARFQARGGFAYQYQDDQRFHQWLQLLNWKP